MSLKELNLKKYNKKLIAMATKRFFTQILKNLLVKTEQELRYLA
jgi:hypothetical protein